MIRNGKTCGSSFHCITSCRMATPSRSMIQFSILDPIVTSKDKICCVLSSGSRTNLRINHLLFICCWLNEKRLYNFIAIVNFCFS